MDALNGPGTAVHRDGSDHATGRRRTRYARVLGDRQDEEAITLANDSEFGLVSALWTRDITRALKLSERIEAGQVFVNTWTTGAVQTPFGGWKHSGYGREKGIEAIHHYSHIKEVVPGLVELEVAVPRLRPTWW